LSAASGRSAKRSAKPVVAQATEEESLCMTALGDQSVMDKDVDWVRRRHEAVCVAMCPADFAHWPVVVQAQLRVQVAEALRLEVVRQAIAQMEQVGGAESLADVVSRRRRQLLMIDSILDAIARARRVADAE
jgi:hypothetical protein